MSWPNSIFVAILTAVSAAIAGFFAASGYVSWYRIPAREGQSGYFILFMILASSFLGLLTGFIGSRFATGFLTGLGATSGAMLSVIGIITLVSWVLADIPPTLNGHELDMVVEFRLPKGAARPPVLPEKQFVWFESGSKAGPSRVRQSRPLDVAKAFYADGRWIIPGSVPIFTTRGSRTLTVALDDQHADGFELPLPGHPGPESKQWSGWLPDAVADHWPETRISYRFRVEERIPVETPAIADPFDALTPDSPLEEWIQCFDAFGRIPERSQAILRQAEKHPAELAGLFQSPNEDTFAQAMNVAHALPAPDPAVLQGMLDTAAGFEDQMNKLASMNPPDAAYSILGERVERRFHLWCPAWEMVQSRSGVDGRPPVERILKVANLHQQIPYMRGIAGDAQTLLGYFATARKP